MKSELSSKKVKKRLLNLLLEFDKICSDNKLRYSLCGGTLIGAVRHKGFIPWDDDIDVMMPRPDYEKLKKIKLNNNREICFPETNSIYPYIYTYAKYYDLDTELIEFPNSKKIKSHIYIDIFPIDGIENDESKHYIQYKKVNRLAKMHRLIRISFYNQNNMNYNYIKRIVWKILWKISFVIPNNFFIKRIDKYVNSYEFDKCKYVGTLVAGFGPKERYEKCMFEITKIDFEGHYFSCISGYDKYLKILYGDYMKLPELSKRVACHDYIAYELKK